MNIAPSIAMAAHSPKMHELVPIFGCVRRICGHLVGIDLQIPSTETLASRTFFGATVGRFLVVPIHERIRMRVVHESWLFVCHVGSVARIEDPVNLY